MPYTHKTYIFRNKGFLSPPQVSEILAQISKTGTKIQNRTHTADEFCDWGNSYPLPPLPLGKSFIFDGLMDVEGGVFPVKFLKTAKSEFFQHVLDEISPWANIHFDIALQHREIELRDLSAGLSLELGQAYVGFTYTFYPNDEGSPIAQAKAVQEFIKLANLPMSLSIKGNTFKLTHTDKRGSVFRPPSQFDEPPSIVKADLPGSSLDDAVARFRAFVEHPDFKASDGSWSMGFPQIDFPKTKEPLKLYDTINKAGFPGKKAKCIINLHLRDFTYFEEMFRMAKLKKGNAVQSLLEFEFDGGRPCQMDALCTMQNKFKVFFSFDELEDAELLAALFKIKLEEY